MEFVISKRRGNDPWVENYQSTYAKQWSETLLDSGKEYSFLVKARNDTVFSDASNIAKARTFIWTEVYKQPLTNNDGPLAGSCLVQRIDKMQLNVTGPVSKVRLSLQGGVNAAGTPLQIERVSVSYPDEGPQGNPNPDAYDSSVPVVVVGPMALPANGTAVWSPVFDFPYVKDKDLLVAFDIKAGNPTQTRKRTTSVGTSKAFSKQSTQEAAIANRLTGYVSQGNAIFLIDKIEMLMA
jgi:hypothetical protein